MRGLTFRALVCVGGYAASETIIRGSRIAFNRADEQMDKHIPQYRIYLLTVWQAQSQNTPQVCWRFRLEDPRTRQSRCFANATALLLALLRSLDCVDTDPEEASFPQIQ
jgi:hypothetical protein